ncbi:MAG: carbohydrate ABC transporter permease [Acetobacteraceae bacterium]
MSRTHRTGPEVWVVLLLAMAFALLPILWGISTALKDNAVAEAFPPTWWPDQPTLANFARVFTGSNVGRYMLNSAIVSLCSILLTLVVSVHAGYAAARWRFVGKRGLMFFILSMGMIPGICILIPVYLLVSELGIYNTYIGLVLVYAAWQIPTAVWIMRGFLEAIPREIEEAAYVDGCTRASAFYRIILPLTQPGMAAVGILVFIYVWNDFLIAYALTISDNMRLIQSGLYLYVTQSGIEWASLMAAAMTALLPPILAFILLQSRFIQGLTRGAVK